MFFENDTYDYLNDKKFLDELQKLKVKEHYLKVELLDFSEKPIQEIQGKCITGNLSVDGASSVRRTCSFSMIADSSSMYDITNVDNLISINKKFKLYVGYKNTMLEYNNYGDIIWFPLGLFVVITASINHTLTGCTINISAKDKMCLLNGEVGGTLPAPVSLHEKYIRNADGSTTILKPLIYEIIRESVIELGEQDPTKIIINDVPLSAKKVLRYMGNTSIFFTDNGNQVPEGTIGAREVKPGDLAGYDFVDFTYPGELIKQAGDSVCSILDSIKNVLGNYEYYFDVHGNFIFQEMKNYLNTSYTPITELTNGDYEVNIGQGNIAYSFKDSDIVVSYANNPNYQNIKNDFIVWGAREAASGANVPIRYHVAIDDIPDVPSEFGDIPWQVYLYKYGLESQKLNTNPGYYFRELQNEIPKLYDFDKNEWLDIDSAKMDYYLDFIDTNSELGKFSIKTIGRRTVAVTDKDVTMLYRPPTPDYVILEKDNPNNIARIEELNAIGQKFMIVEQRNLYQYAAVGKDAFSVIRDLIFKHTTYNETISLSTMPIYHIEPNIRIEVEDSRSNIHGDYIIKSMTLPLTHEGTMSITALRAFNRL